MDMAFPDSRAVDAGTAASGLRPLAWHELCARLAAAQDLRRTQANAAGHGQIDPATALGSFHGGAAHLLEHYVGPQDLVNPTSSINRKDRGSKDDSSRETRADCALTRLADENCHD